MILKPDYNLESVFDIPKEELLQKGIKALFFDLDSTIMESKSGTFTPDVKNWLCELEKDFKIAIISNNNNEEYINNVKCQIHYEVRKSAAKPDVKIIKQVMNIFELLPEQTAMIGDRPLTDILAGKKAGMMTILVDSISKERENLPTRFVRFLERLTIKKF